MVSGYTDSTGNAEINAKLSKERAFAVRDALLAAGVPESSIELRKPASDTGSGTQRRSPPRRSGAGISPIKAA